MDAIQIGKERQKAHPNGTQRYYKDENKEDIIGIAGEIAFGKRYSLTPDLEIKPQGDNHIDFKIKINDDIVSTIDVKTAQKAYNLLIKKWEINKCANILVLAQYIDVDNIKFLGWTTRQVMQKQPTKVFSSLNIENYYLHYTKLYEMKLLDAIFDKSKIEQIL
jgi:hypothetical protein